MTQIGHCAQGIQPCSQVLTENFIRLVLVYMSASAPLPLFCENSPDSSNPTKKRREALWNENALRGYYDKMKRE